MEDRANNMSSTSSSDDSTKHTPNHLFGSSGDSPSSLSNIISILNHSSDLPKGFCVIASYKLPVEKILVLRALYDIFEKIAMGPPTSNAPDPQTNDKELQSPDHQTLLYGILLMESLLESPICKKLSKKEYYYEMAEKTIAFMFKWLRQLEWMQQHQENSNVSQQSSEPSSEPSLDQILTMQQNTTLRCFSLIRVVLKSFPLLVTKQMASQIELYAAESVVFLNVLTQIVQKLKLRHKTATTSAPAKPKGFLDVDILLNSLVEHALARPQMDSSKDIAVDLVCLMYKMAARLAPELKEKVQAAVFESKNLKKESPLTLSTLRDYFTLIDEERARGDSVAPQDESNTSEGARSGRRRLVKRQSSKNLLDSTGNSTLRKVSSSSSLASNGGHASGGSQFQFNASSSITKELLKSKVRRSAASSSSSSLHKQPLPSFRRLITQLTHLSLENCNLTDIDNLQYCINLRVLYLYNNKIRRIEGLDNLVHLTQLYLQNNCIQKIEGLNTLTALKKLHLEKNYISSLEGLTQNRLLSELYLSNQRVWQEDGDSQKSDQMAQSFTFDLSTLYNLQHSLSILSLSNCGVQDATDLSICNNLQKLDLSKNQISSFDNVLKLLTNNFVLYELDLSGNPVCSATKYRDQIIVNSTHALQLLDTKPIQANVRSFLLNKKKQQSAKGSSRSRRTKPAGLNDNGEILKVGRPRVYNGSRSVAMGTQKEHHGISVQNLDVARK